MVQKQFWAMNLLSEVARSRLLRILTFKDDSCFNRERDSPEEGKVVSSNFISIRDWSSLNTTSKTKCMLFSMFHYSISEIEQMRSFGPAKLEM